MGTERTNTNETAYLRLLEHVLEHGERRSDRTGVGTRSLFGLQLETRLDLPGAGFPVLTTKRIHWPAVANELLWFLYGRTDVQWLHDRETHIWDQWTDRHGDLGPIYGAQWRAWQIWRESGDYSGEYEIEEHDQIAAVVEAIRADPYSRRHVVSAWNVSDLPAMRLHPCHALFQFYVSNRPVEATHRIGEPDVRAHLDCHLYQRSADLFLGVPFNLASYALLTYLVADATNTVPGRLIVSYGDVHVYENHVEAVKTQLARAARPAPRLRLAAAPGEIRKLLSTDYREARVEAADLVLESYDPHPRIPAPVAV